MRLAGGLSIFSKISRKYYIKKRRNLAGMQVPSSFNRIK